MCKVESSLNPWAVRFEPGYKWFYEPVKFAEWSRISVDTERALQAMSYGLMQVMGAVCREYGYRGDLIRIASDAEQSLTFACKHLRKLTMRFGEVECIPAYNAGSPRKTPGGLWVNQGYVDKVHAELVKAGHPLASAR
jgi:hypothetical protein